jgi:molybdate transport system substrate-binding protein
MKIKGLHLRTAALAVVVLLVSAAAFADEVKVITSGAFTAAYLQLVPEFERTTRHKIVTTFGASMGSGPNTIPSRLQRGEAADVVILAGSALDDLIKQGKVVAGSRVDLVRSLMGMAVRAGAPKPDITSVDGLTQTLLHAKSVAISSSASGVYLSTELFQRLGIAEQMKPKTRISEEAVGTLVASGEAEIGFQQISELLPVPASTTSDRCRPVRKEKPYSPRGLFQVLGRPPRPGLSSSSLPRLPPLPSSGRQGWIPSALPQRSVRTDPRIGRRYEQLNSSSTATGKLLAAR